MKTVLERQLYMRTWRRTEGQSSIKQVINDSNENGACLIFPLKVTICKGVVFRAHAEGWRWPLMGGMLKVDWRRGITWFYRSSCGRPRPLLPSGNSRDPPPYTHGTDEGQVYHWRGTLSPASDMTAHIIHINRIFLLLQLLLSLKWCIPCREL